VVDKKGEEKRGRAVNRDRAKNDLAADGREAMAEWASAEGREGNLTKAERNELAAMADAIFENCRR
jgi:hypothetical protein